MLIFLSQKTATGQQITSQFSSFFLFEQMNKTGCQAELTIRKGIKKIFKANGWRNGVKSTILVSQSLHINYFY